MENTVQKVSPIDKVYVITKTGNGKLCVGNKVIERGRDKVIARLLSEQATNQIYASINNLFPDVAASFNYCTNLDSAFSALGPFSEYRSSEKSIFLPHVAHRLNAYYLEQKIDEIKKDPLVLAFSHRRSGWSLYEFKLGDSFNFIAKTNFGYGSSVSYFYSIIKYRNIILAPFSEIVEYPHAKYKEVIRYSAKHNLQYEEWQNSFQFICDNYNLAFEDEKKFLDQYFEANLKSIKKYLQYFSDLNVNAVREVNENYKVLSEHEYSPYELLGNKFCECIKVLKSVKKLEVKEFNISYYSLLKDFEEKIVKTLTEGLTEIPRKIENLENKLRNFKKENQQVIRKENKNKERRYKNEKIFYSSVELDAYLSKKFNDYCEIAMAYAEYKVEKEKIEKEISVNKQTLKLVPKYLLFIKKTLQGQA